MKHPIAGVAPAAEGEVTVMTVWPTIAATGLGCFLGRLYRIGGGIGWLTIGKLIALASIPVALIPFFSMLDPFAGRTGWFSRLMTRLNPFPCRRYRLTNRRVIIECGLAGHPEQWVDLNRFDSIEVEVKPGQEWYPAGDLIFRRGQIETFRLLGVSRPETFRQTILKTAQGYLGAQAAIA